jgi:hypothetical protein
VNYDHNDDVEQIVKRSGGKTEEKWIQAEISLFTSCAILKGDSKSMWSEAKSLLPWIKQIYTESIP